MDDLTILASPSVGTLEEVTLFSRQQSYSSNASDASLQPPELRDSGSGSSINSTPKATSISSASTVLNEDFADIPTPASDRIYTRVTMPTVAVPDPKCPYLVEAMHEKSGDPYSQVWRSYAHFGSFREQLLKKYPYALVPPLPPPLVSEKKTLTEMDENLSLALMDAFLYRVVKHEILAADASLTTFLEEDDAEKGGFKPRASNALYDWLSGKPKQEAVNVLEMPDSLGQSARITRNSAKHLIGLDAALRHVAAVQIDVMEQLEQTDAFLSQACLDDLTQTLWSRVSETKRFSMAAYADMVEANQRNLVFPLAQMALYYEEIDRVLLLRQYKARRVQELMAQADKLTEDKMNAQIGVRSALAKNWDKLAPSKRDPEEIVAALNKQLQDCATQTELAKAELDDANAKVDAELQAFCEIRTRELRVRLQQYAANNANFLRKHMSAIDELIADLNCLET